MRKDHAICDDTKYLTIQTDLDLETRFSERWSTTLPAWEHFIKSKQVHCSLMRAARTDVSKRNMSLGSIIFQWLLKEAGKQGLGKAYCPTSPPRCIPWFSFRRIPPQ
jgi:hypothetical protein